MAKAILDQNGQVRIHCPACGHDHALNVTVDGRPKWSFDGNVERPTFSPSILERCGHYVPGQPQPPNCAACNEAERSGYAPLCYVCHSFVRGGRIEFLSDCTHGLAGQTVELPDV